MLEGRDVTRTPQGIFCAIPQHFNDTGCTHHTQHSSVDAFHRLQLSPPLKIESFLVVHSYSLACSSVDDSLCDHILFGVKPHSRYKMSNVVHVVVSLPIASATIHVATWCHLKCNSNLDALTEFPLNEPNIIQSTRKQTAYLEGM
ncbi:hypothetical protein TNCV_1125091 [Trichonephila clavipes]|uniref:Uncharacterized protein n=1 Tax=Trichonephila clavipes TaxID=2585209 RepID=A0A8X6VKG4_TRICX|nr:hypothetical protein TNCV_1125091 [Trichonephila clavipes]